MLYEGNVIACIQIVDEVSISTSTNFTIHVLLDPNDGSSFTATDDFTEFQQAVINLASVEQEARDQMADHQSKFEEMQVEFESVKADSAEAKELSEKALGIASEALETIEDFTIVAKELQQQEQENKNRIDEIEQTADKALEKTDLIATNVAEVAVAVREVAEKIANIKCDCGLKEEEVMALIQQELNDYITAEEASKFTTKQELEEKVRNIIEKAEQEHTALWNALQIDEVI